MISEKGKKKRQIIIEQMKALELHMKANEWDEMMDFEIAIKKLGDWLAFPVGRYINKINAPYEDKWDELLVEMLNTK